MALIPLDPDAQSEQSKFAMMVDAVVGRPDGHAEFKDVHFHVPALNVARDRIAAEFERVCWAIDPADQLTRISEIADRLSKTDRVGELSARTLRWAVINYRTTRRRRCSCG